MGFPVWSGAGSASNASSSLTPSMPTHAVGDLLVVVVYNKHGNTDTTYSGWTVEQNVSSDGERDITVAYKTAASTSESLTWTRPAVDSEAWSSTAYVFPSGTFDSSDPIGTIRFDDGSANGVSIPSSNDLPDHTAGDKNEFILVVQGHGDDDIGNVTFHGKPTPWNTSLRTDTSTTAGSDSGLRVIPLLLFAGETAEGVGMDYSGASTRGHAMAIVPVRSNDATVPTTEDFSANNNNVNNEPFGPMFEGYERQDSTSWCEITSGHLRFQSKNNTNRFSAAIRYPKSVSDHEILFDVDTDGTQTSRWAYVWMRSSGGFGTGNFSPNKSGGGSIVEATEGIGFRFKGNEAQVVSSTGGSLSTHGSAATLSFTGAMTIGVRADISGGRVRARFWDKSGSEPGTWDIDETITAPIDTGWLTLCDQHVGGGSNSTWYLDDFTITEVPPGLSGTVSAVASNSVGIEVQVDLAGSSTAVASNSGALTQFTPPDKLVGSSSVVAEVDGALSVTRPVTGTVSGVVELSASIDSIIQLNSSPVSAVAENTARVRVPAFLNATLQAVASSSGATTEIGTQNLNGTSTGEAQVLLAYLDAGTNELGSTSTGEAEVIGGLQRFVSALGVTEIRLAYLDAGINELSATINGDTSITASLIELNQVPYQPVNYPLGGLSDITVDMVSDALEILESPRAEVQGALDVPESAASNGTSTVSGTMFGDFEVISGESEGDSTVTGEIFVDAIIELGGTSTGEAVVYTPIGDLLNGPIDYGFAYYFYINVGAGFDDTDASGDADSQSFTDGNIIQDFSQFLYQYINVGVGFDDTDDVSTYPTFVSQTYPDGDIVQDFSRFLYQYLNVVDPVEPPFCRLTIGPAPRGHKDLTPTPRPPRKANR